MNNNVIVAKTTANENFIIRVRDSYLSKINLPVNFCTRIGVRTFEIDVPMLNVHEKFKVMYPSQKDDKNNITDEHGLIFNYGLVLEHGIDDHTHYIFINKSYEVYDYLGTEINEICLNAGLTAEEDKPYHFTLDESHKI